MAKSFRVDLGVCRRSALRYSSFHSGEVASRPPVDRHPLEDARFFVHASSVVALGVLRVTRNSAPKRSTAGSCPRPAYLIGGGTGAVRPRPPELRNSSILATRSKRRGGRQAARRRRSAFRPRPPAAAGGLRRAPAPCACACCSKASASCPRSST